LWSILSISKKIKMTYILKNLTQEEALSFAQWVEQTHVASKVKEKAVRKTKKLEGTLDFEKFDERTKRVVQESIAAYEAGDMTYFKVPTEYYELQKELEEAGILCGA
jgi:hypothetical protein